MSATDFKQVLAVRLRHKSEQSPETQPELFFDHSAVRDIIAIFVASEIIGRIKFPQLLFRQGEISGRELAFFARQQSGDPGWTIFPTANQTVPFH